MTDILVVDDEKDIRSILRGILEDEGYTIREAGTVKEAHDQLMRKVPDLLVLDVWLDQSDRDGLNILERAKAGHPELPVLMMSGHGTIEMAVTALRHGAYDFIEKPFKTDRLLVLIDRALETARLRRENRALREQSEGPSDLIGTSSAINAVRQIIMRVAPTNSRVLISGEPGTGKEIVARLVHKSSQRSSGPFVALNCASMHPDRLESALFGSAASPGLLEQADKGTLLLDEVSDMPLETQGKILRVLQEQKFQRLGTQDWVQVDLRVIASTNRSLPDMIEKGQFREDLYYRLNVVPLAVPALRTRSTDIPELIQHFMAQYAQATGLPLKAFSESAITALQTHKWPGNVRQLRNAIEWIMIMSGSDSSEIRADQLPPDLTSDPSGTAREGMDYSLMAMPLRDAREQFERDYLLAQVQRFGGNISRTAQFVGMERSALHRKLKSLNVNVGSAEDDAEEASAKLRAV